MEKFSDSISPDLLLDKTNFTEKDSAAGNSLVANMFLRDHFLDEEDIDLYLAELNANNINGVSDEQIRRVKTVLDNFRPYLRQYQDQTAARIERFDHHLKISAKKLSNPALSFAEVRRSVRIRLRSALAREMADQPRGISGKTLRIASGAGGVDYVMDNETTAQLRIIATQYENLPEQQKAKMTWTDLRNRLLANEDYYLDLVMGMQNNGVLIGFDNSGNPLFADSEPVPELFNLDYNEARRRVMYRLRKDNETMYCGGVPVATGYELFPAGDNDELSPEIEMFKQATGRHIVNPDEYCEWAASWLESGEKPKRAKTAYRTYHTEDTTMESEDAEARFLYLGAVRLVRVKTLKPSIYPPETNNK